MSYNSELSNTNRKYIFMCIIISCIASTFLSSALTTALPTIMVDLDITASTGQWLTSGYSLVLGIVMPLTAFLITRVPSRKLYLSALSISMLGSVLASIANSFEILMLARILQAVGGGILSAMAQVILLTIYPIEIRGRVMGWYGLAIGGAAVFAPTIAGAIIDIFGWRAIFYTSFAIMLLIFILTIKFFENVLETRDVKFDTLSFVLSAFAFAGITLGIGNLGAYELTSFFVMGMIVIGITAMIIFVLRQLRLDDPYLDVRILRNKKFVGAVLVSMILYLVMMAPSIIMPIYIQMILGMPATVAGLVSLPGSICMMVLNPSIGKVYDKVGIKLLYLIGSIALVLSNFGMSMVTVETTIWVAVFCNIIRGIGIACVLMPLITWSLSNVEQEEMAHGSALLSALRSISGAIGAALFLNIMMYVAERGVDPMSREALMHGANISYIGMGILSIIMVLMGIFVIGSKKDDSKQENN